MKKETFKQNYIKHSQINEMFFNKHFIVMECNCDYEGCQGFAVVGNNNLSIKTHEELYTSI